jgi:hypothetical protein
MRLLGDDMALFGYLFDSNFKSMRERDRQRGEAPNDEVALDPFEDAETVKRLRSDMARVMVLNRALIKLLIQKDLISLPELTELSKQINLEQDSKSHEEMEICEDCGRHSYRARANCVYCGALQL